MIRKKEARVLEFHSGITREFLLFFFANLAMAGLIIAFGVNINQSWDGRGNMFVVIGGLVMICALTLFSKVRGKTIRMTGRAFAYREGKVEKAFLWQNLRTFQVPPASKKFFRSAVVGDMDNTFVIDSLTFPDYELIVNVIAMTRRQFRDRAYEIGG
ncbi:MAG: hypothetical protein FJX76_03330 [Armatimonadetes bacterium]|nr:hypothetical protein [Armatimonadota bacterium]